MIRDYRSVREVASAIANAGEMAMEAYCSARVADEPHITDRFMQAIEMTMNGGATATLAFSLRAVDHLPAFRVRAEDEVSRYRPHGPLIWQAHTVRSGPEMVYSKKWVLTFFCSRGTILFVA
jgi:hypothetical protein